VTVTPLTAERVRQILSLVGTIKRAPRPLVPPTEEEIIAMDLMLDRKLFFPPRGGASLAARWQRNSDQ